MVWQQIQQAQITIFSFLWRVYELVKWIVFNPKGILTCWVFLIFLVFVKQSLLVFIMKSYCCWQEGPPGLQQNWRNIEVITLCCFNTMLWRGWSVLFIMFTNLFSIPPFTINSRAVPSTEPAFFISLLSLFELLALMLLPQQMPQSRLPFPQ